MGLSEYKVIAGLAVSDMDRAREFYEGKLGLAVEIDSGGYVAYWWGRGPCCTSTSRRSTRAGRQQPWPATRGYVRDKHRIESLNLLM